MRTILVIATLAFAACSGGNDDTAGAPEDETTPADMPEQAWGGWRLMQRDVQVFEAQDRDERWAAPAERILTSSFAAGEDELGFHLSSVECRTDRCVVVTEWDSFANARKQLVELSWLTPMDVNCAGAAAVSPKPDKPFEVYVLVDCRTCSGTTCPRGSERP
jgi:hypothetical protein